MIGSLLLACSLAILRSWNPPSYANVVNSHDIHALNTVSNAYSLLVDDNLGSQDYSLTNDSDNYFNVSLDFAYYDGFDMLPDVSNQIHWLYSTEYDYLENDLFYIPIFCFSYGSVGITQRTEQTLGSYYAYSFNTLPMVHINGAYFYGLLEFNSDYFATNLILLSGGVDSAPLSSNQSDSFFKNFSWKYSIDYFEPYINSTYDTGKGHLAKEHSYNGYIVSNDWSYRNNDDMFESILDGKYIYRIPLNSGYWETAQNVRISFANVTHYTPGTDYQQGYNDGYNVGLVDGSSYSNTFFGLFNAIADTPILMLRSLFNFDVFGVNMLVVVMSLLTGTIVFYLIRKYFNL